MKKEEIAFKKGYRINIDGEIVNPNGKIIKGSILNCRNIKYRKFNIRDFNNNIIRIKVHRLMGYQKFGNKIYDETMQIRHLNGNSLDNSYNNIGIGTASENANDKDEKVRKESAHKASLSSSKYDKDFVDSLKKDRNDGLTYKELMDKYHISSKGTISFLINSRTLFK